MIWRFHSFIGAAYSLKSLFNYIIRKIRKFGKSIEINENSFTSRPLEVKIEKKSRLSDSNIKIAMSSELFEGMFSKIPYYRITFPHEYINVIDLSYDKLTHVFMKY